MAFLHVTKGDKYDLPTDRTFDQVNVEVEDAQADFLQLQSQIAKANETFTIQWDERAIAVGEALDLAKLYRQQASDYAGFGSQRDNELDRSRLGVTQVMRVLTYDPKNYAEKARKLTRKANKLSDLIDEANIQNRINFPNYSVYMD